MTGEFNPDWRSHPGDTLRDMLEERHMSQSYLAWSTGFSAKHINQVVQGHMPIRVDLALKLEEEFEGVPAEFWLTRQMHYDLHVARKERGLPSPMERALSSSAVEIRMIDNGGIVATGTLNRGSAHA